MGVTATGGCLCGAVTYTVSGDMRPVIACHCQQCRKSSGHYVAATAAQRDLIKITGPVSWYQSSEWAKRGFCATCGSSLFWDGPGDDMSIMAGTLDTAPGIALEGHIFCADKGAYYQIADGLPASVSYDLPIFANVGKDAP